MADPMTIAGAGLAVLGSKDVLGKLLGPSAEYLGGKASGLIEKCDLNLDDIFARAFKKIAGRVDEPGQVNARILKNVVDEGRFVEDGLVAEYYAGLLASSRTRDGLDDRGLPHLAMVKMMSVYQIRLHFYIYHSILRLFGGKEINVGQHDGRRRLMVYAPLQGARDVLMPDVNEGEDFESVFLHSINGLYSHGLISEYKYGSVANINSMYGGADVPGFVVTPTYAGIELFMWAIGAQRPDAHEFLKKRVDDLTSPISIDSLAVAVNGKG
ncbi:TPA: hypothetical protein ACOENK_003638 [Stenotrophomonas maltophilia]|nr:hypothetical protein A1OC_02025 [Stenotrophomonas maltophilia Ab55555]RSC48882.1 hypothetical protein EGS96_06340 [Stenotrophomonas maltophilia]